jgi:LysM repeat protein
MKRKRGVRRIAVIVLATVMAGSLYGSDKLPTSSCQDRNNLRLLGECDPYQIRLIRVSPQRIAFRRVHRRIPLGKTLSGAGNYAHERRVTLQKLVEKYIEYEEALLQRRTTYRRRALLPPKSRKASPKKLPEKRTEAQRESRESEEHPTLHEVLGERPVETMLLPVEKREKTVHKKLLPVKKPPEIRAAEKEKPLSPVEHIVAPGESLISLARQYQTTVYDIRRWNRLPRDHLLKAGEKLTIRPGEKTPPEKIREALRREKFGYYRVKKGDTLIGIARRFSVKTREIMELNGLKRRNHLRIGQKLMLPLEPKRIEAVLKKEQRFKYASDKRFKRKIRVIATAYTSHRGQTDRTPFLAAWNNRIRPGMKIIAVSPDLIRKYGITNGTKVKISGLPGVYTVRDKMNRRLKNHIDIYMGTNRRKALRWGRRRVILYW